jgi:hypothetical protein
LIVKKKILFIFARNSILFYMFYRKTHSCERTHFTIIIFYFTPFCIWISKSSILGIHAHSFDIGCNARARWREENWNKNLCNHRNNFIIIYSNHQHFMLFHAFKLIIILANGNFPAQKEERNAVREEGSQKIEWEKIK